MRGSSSASYAGGMQKTEIPATPLCLVRPYRANPSQKGGTLIAQHVTTLEGHERLVADPDGYRHDVCENPACLASSCLHCHENRTRVLNGERCIRLIPIRIYRCVCCGAVWRVLPAFVARYLHRDWSTVQTAVESPETSKLPPSTLDRWLARLALPARVLTNLLVTVAHADLRTNLDGLWSRSSRAELVAVIVATGLVDASSSLEQIAAWVHRIEPGVRLM